MFRLFILVPLIWISNVFANEKAEKPDRALELKNYKLAINLAMAEVSKWDCIVEPESVTTPVDFRDMIARATGFEFSYILQTPVLHLVYRSGTMDEDLSIETKDNLREITRVTLIRSYVREIMVNEGNIIGPKLRKIRQMIPSFAKTCIAQR